MANEELDKDTAEVTEIPGQEAQASKTAEPTPEDALRSGLATLEAEQSGEKPGVQTLAAKEEQPKEKSQSESKKAAVTEDKDAFLESLPEDAPTPDHWKKMREQYKELKKQLKTAPQAQVQTQQTTQEQARFALGQQSPQSQSKRFDTEWLIETVASINAGKIGEEFRREAEEELSKASPAELRQVMQKARSKGYGEASPEIFEAAKEWLPVAIAGADEVRQAQTQAAHYQRIRQEAWTETIQAYPGIENPATENGQKFASALSELSVEIPGFQTLPNAMRVLREFVELRGAKAERDTLKADNERMAVEINALRQKYGAATSPQSRGASTTNQKNKSASPEEGLRAGLSALGVGTQ